MRARSSAPILAALAALAALGPAAARAQEPSQTTPGPNCGEEIQKASGTEWKCTFADDFDGKELDRSKWSVLETATMGLSAGGECYVDDPEHVSVDGGHLTLTATRLPEPQWCGWFDSSYHSGMIFTGDKFAQTYGRFEARVRFPTGTGFASGFWMWPLEMAYGQQSGEIDVAEHFGYYSDLVAAHTHIIYEGADRGGGKFCQVANPGEWHTYAVEWLRPGAMTFLYDGKPCWTFNQWDPGAPLTYPQPFDRPFFLLLTLGLGYGENSPTADTPFPGKFVVDYVRAWE
jgi:beta-glucanase (GH16 family)